MANVGGVTFTSNSEKVLQELRKALPAILEEWGAAGERFAKEEITRAVYDTAPSPTYNRTGNLRNSLTHTTDESAAYIGTNVEYAAYVEFGTSKMRPRPYLRPAVQNHIDDYREIARKHLT